MTGEEINIDSGQVTRHNLYRSLMRLFIITCLCLSTMIPVVDALPASAADTTELRDLVDKSRITLESFLADPNLGWFRDHVKDAKGILIVPQFLKGAFFVGGAGGSG